MHNPKGVVKNTRRTCIACYKTLSSSQSLRRHKKICKALEKSKIDQIINRVGITIKDEDLRKKLTDDNKVYLQKIELGRKIAKIIKEGKIHERSLSVEHAEALKVHRKQLDCFVFSEKIYM